MNVSNQNSGAKKDVFEIETALEIKARVSQGFLRFHSQVFEAALIVRPISIVSAALKGGSRPCERPLKNTRTRTQKAKTKRRRGA